MNLKKEIHNCKQNALILNKLKIKLNHTITHSITLRLKLNIL